MQVARLFSFGVLGVVLLAGDVRGSDSTGSILRQVWKDLSGSQITDLTSEDNFPDYPSASETLTSFEAPIDLLDNYGSRIAGYVHPPKTGEYTFWIAADDHCELWLSSSEDPAKKTLIAFHREWTGSKEWEKHGSQKSKPVRLETGKRYYVEALHKEGIGGDNLAVGWQMPDGVQERPIPGNRLSPFTPPKPGPKVPKPPPSQPGHYKRKITCKVGDKNITIPYLLYLPPDYATNPAPKPVLVFLHGVGERGTDLGGVYGWGPDGRILDVPGFKERYPFIGISPQAPVTHRWENAEMYKCVIAAIDEVLKTYNADKDRVYLTGLSMGGRGTWEVALEAPDRFAAIAPISSVAVRPPEAAEKLKKVHTWVICGANDGDFTKGSMQMYETLKKTHAAEVKLAKHEGWGHDVWREYYPTKVLYEWFLTKKRMK